MVRSLALAMSLLAAALPTLLQAAPSNFSEAKRLARQHVYFDQNVRSGGTFYCGCDWSWAGKSGGTLDYKACGYKASSQLDRAARIEYEHVMAISAAGQQRQCWRNGGRANCQRTDPVFNRMEADMHNLVVAVGHFNAIRSNINLGMVSGSGVDLGSCQSKIANQGRSVEPRDESKGMAARITFYMADRYGVQLSRSQQQTMMAWDRQYPVTAWEIERDRRIARAMGHSNPFVTGQIKWALGHRPSRAGLAAVAHQAQPRPAPQRQIKPAQPRPLEVASVGAGLIYGNKNSGVYHLPTGCPSYLQVSPRNRVEFGTEQEAAAAGFRKAGNCR